MVDLKRESLVTFAQANRLLPEGGRINTSTWWRWHRKGRHGIRLETVVCGGRRYTTEQAVHRFFSRLTELDGGTIQATAPATQSKSTSTTVDYLQGEGILPT